MLEASIHLLGAARVWELSSIASNSFELWTLDVRHEYVDRRFEVGPSSSNKD